MRFISYVVFVTRAGRSEQAAFLTQRKLLPDRSLTLAAQFWAEDDLEHRLQVVDEPAVGPSRVVATCQSVVPAANGLVSLDLTLLPLATPGTHRLHLDVDGETVMSEPIQVTVREIPRRGRRARYKGRGTLPALGDRPAASDAANEWRGWPRAGFSSSSAFVGKEAGGGYLRHGELFPMERSAATDGTVSGLWLAAYFRGFGPQDEGVHLFSVATGDSHNVLGLQYAEVSGPRHSMKLPLDTVVRAGPHELVVAIDGQDVGQVSVTV